MHYRVTDKHRSPRSSPGELFLIDSGAQYEDGTTDITRTLAVGAPTRGDARPVHPRAQGPHRRSRARCSPTAPPARSSIRSRASSCGRPGLDFDHGTGHGVGSYLSVHEGPARISKLGTTALERGMILSNEPGYYKTGAYGIRIENLVLVVEAPPVAGAEKPLDAFETLTLAPIERRLIEPRLLTAEETAWLDRYHARVAETLVAAARRRDPRLARGRHPPARAVDRLERLRDPMRVPVHAQVGSREARDATYGLLAIRQAVPCSIRQRTTRKPERAARPGGCWRC